MTRLETQIFAGKISIRLCLFVCSPRPCIPCPSAWLVGQYAPVFVACSMDHRTMMYRIKLHTLSMSDKQSRFLLDYVHTVTFPSVRFQL